MLAIQDCKAPLTAQIETINIDLSLLKHDIQNLCKRTGAAEECISLVGDIVCNAAREMVALQALNLINWRTCLEETTCAF